MFILKETGLGFKNQDWVQFHTADLGNCKRRLAVFGSAVWRPRWNGVVCARPEVGEGVRNVAIFCSITGRRNGKHKSPGVRDHLACWKHSGKQGDEVRVLIGRRKNAYGPWLHKIPHTIVRNLALSWAKWESTWGQSRKETRCDLSVKSVSLAAENRLKEGTRMEKTRGQQSRVEGIDLGHLREWLNYFLNGGLQHGCFKKGPTGWLMDWMCIRSVKK